MINRNSLKLGFIGRFVYARKLVGKALWPLNPVLRLSIYCVFGLVPAHDEVSSVRRAFGECLGTKRR